MKMFSRAMNKSRSKCSGEYDTSSRFLITCNIKKAPHARIPLDPKFPVDIFDLLVHSTDQLSKDLQCLFCETYSDSTQGGEGGK